ncbi:Hypothetical predicted protein [Paramuricea clavata]|uniref:Uncharacterized protein n=1 Tax=Paramuricea clavata TaxID=317549 RepID=A0A6S7FMY5_PARCT|nr:Hypothetical predicted protein [Paramuricea clavata]
MGTGIVTDEILPPLKHQGVEGRVRYLVLLHPIHDTNHKDGNNADTSDQNPSTQQSDPSRETKGNEEAPQEERIRITTTHFALDFMKGLEIGKISEKLDHLSEENKKLREKLKKFKEDNAALNQTIGSLQDRNQKQEETIRDLESFQEKLQKDLENVKKEKEQLRIEFSEKNETLTEQLEALTKDFEAVENENKELKRSLEELTTSNNSLKQDINSIKKEMGNLKAGHKKICEKLECKEARLALGQIAWLLEAEIWKAVLPDKTMGKTGILFSMKRWLKKNTSSPEVIAAQKRWDDLKRTLKWDEDDHTDALKCLKELRKEDAHPENVDLEVARKQLIEGNHVAEMDKKTCEDIIDMIVTARELNNSK